MPRAAASREVKPTLAQLSLYFLRLGTFGFGGPIALAGYMQRDLVEDRGWVSDTDYHEGLAFSQLAPGPLAAQLAMYIGWLHGGAPAALLVATGFILPSFLMVTAMAVLYVHYGRMGWIQGAFHGIGAAVIAIIALSAYKLSRRALRNDWLLWILFAIVAVTTAWTESEIVWLFLLCGVVAVAVRSSGMLAVVPPVLVTGLHGPAPRALTPLFLFFIKAGAFVFGSGLAIVPFLYGEVVTRAHWLTEHQFLDAVAVAMITPGPVVITAAFIGYLVSGAAGAVVASIAVFAPALIFVLAGAPYYRRLARNEHVKAFVQGVTAAAVGAISGAGFVLGRRAIVDFPTLLIALAALAVLLYFRKIPETVLILAAGIVGLLVYKTM